MSLRAGPLSLRLADDGSLRHVRVGDVEVLRRLAVVVRDDAWGTVAPELASVDVEQAPGGEGFAVRAQARCRRGPLDLRWDLRLRGEADGTLRCSLRVEPLAAFAFNRIGFVLLHPLAGHAGRPIRGEGPDGEAVAGVLPEVVGPQREEGGVLLPLFGPVRALALEPAPGLGLHLAFSGDLFELEDQRNWTDGSFKTYSTPLALGVPHRAEPGRPVVQEVRLAVGGPAVAAAAARRRPAGVRPVAEVGAAEAEAPLPALGVALGAAGTAVPAAALPALAALGLAHLRVDVPADPALAARSLGAAEEAARAAGCPLELALVDGAPPSGLAAPAAAVARVLALAPGAVDAPEALAAAARAALPGLPVAGGTDGHFADLNRTRPDVRAFDGVAFPASPGSHLADLDTLVEGLEGLRDAARSAATLFGLPVHVSPVALRPRRGPGSEARDDEPQGTDRRQATEFGAAWVVGAVGALVTAGAASATVFEAAGARGVVDERGRPVGAYGVLAALAPHAGSPARAARVPDPLALAGVWVAGGLVLANLTGDEAAVRVPGLGPRPVARGLAGGPPRVDGDVVALAPYASARLDPGRPDG